MPRIMRKGSGQAMLLLVLIALVASLGLALTIATRSMKEQKSSSYNLEGEQSYSAAESGFNAMVDWMSSTPAASINCTTPTPKNETLGNSSFEATYECLSSSGGNALILPTIELKKDVPEVFYVNANVQSVSVSWQREGIYTPGIEIDAYANAGVYEQKSYYWGTNTKANLEKPTYNSGTGTSSVTMTLPADSIALQITARSADAKNVIVTLTPAAGRSVPVQGYEITSEGTAGQSKRYITAFYRPQSVANTINNVLYAGDIVGN